MSRVGLSNHTGIKVWAEAENVRMIVIPISNRSGQY